MANYNNRNGGTSSVKEHEMYPSSYGTLDQTVNVIELVMDINAAGDRVGTYGGGFYRTAYE